MFSFAPDAWSFVWKLAAAAVITRLIGWPTVAWVLVALAGFTLFFFRDPDRTPPSDPALIVSPADGKVLRIEQIPHDDFIGGPAKKVAIFLSIFNVHINRSPIAGTILFQQYRPGKMLPAWKSHASEENERNSIGIEGQGIRMIVNQITGLIARRIVSRVSVGDSLARGQRYGLIKFGSCTEFVLPAQVEILVKVGDKVKGAETAVARLPAAR
jgi:phosphatidylserine decarboxylase